MSTLYASQSYSRIFGTNRADYIYHFYHSAVNMAGGYGNDHIYNEGIYSSMFGEDGNDIITSTGDYTYIDGGSGNDMVSLAPNTNRATISYFDGDGNDTIYGFNNSIVLDIKSTWSSSVRSGNDAIIRVGTGSIRIIGGGSLVSSVNTYGIQNSSIRFAGTSSAELILNHDGNYVTMNSGAGNDSISNYGNYVSISAGNGNDSIYNSSGHHVTIIGGNGNDSILNRGNYGSISGGNGKDFIQNDSNSRTKIDAGRDNDRIRSTNTKYSTIIAGAGNDTIIDSKSNNNLLSGGTGNDVISLNSSNSKNVTINYSNGDGNDTIYGFGTDDVFNITSGKMSSSVQSDGSIVISNYSSVRSGSDIILTIGSGKVTFKNAAGKSLNITPFRIYQPAKNRASVLASNQNDLIRSENYTRVTLNGGSGNDSISISSASVTAIGGAGDDSIFASSSSKNVPISGGNGKDIIAVSGTNITIVGGADNDSISTNNAQKVKIYAGVGNDSLRISGKSISASAGDGNDYIDIYNSNAKNISVDAGKGKDTISVNATNVTVNGGAGNDSIRFNSKSNNVKIYAGDGNDKIYGTGGKNITISGGNGNDSISISSGSNISIVGGNGNDTIRNSASKSRIEGGVGADRIYNSASSVSINGGSGNDIISISSSAKNVVINYDARSGGNDTIYGFNADDRINVINGNISSSVRSGSNAILTTGNGKITLVGGASIVSNNVSVKNANSRINGTAYSDSIYNGGYNRVTINAGAGNDTIYDRNGNYSSISAGAGNDYVYLYSVNSSKIDAGAGNDSIVMRYGGKNTITGGLGNDLISIASNSQNVTINYAEGDGNDKIYGFRSGDHLNITSGDISSSVKSGNNAILTIGSGKITLIGAASLIPNAIRVQSEFSVVNGTSKNDSILNHNDGSFSAHNYVTIKSGAGNDIIRNALASHTSIDAGTGNDLVSLWSSYYSNVYAGDGDDTIIQEDTRISTLAGGKGNDVISLDSSIDDVVINYTTGDGNDTIYGFKDEKVALNIDGSISSSVQSGRNAVLTVGNGKITLVDFNLTNKRVKSSWSRVDGTSSADSILNDSNNSDLPFIHVTINSGAGNDTIYDKLGSYNSIDAGTGNDSINLFNSMYTTVDAGAGNDSILSALGYNSLIGGKGNDVVSLSSNASRVTISYADGDGDDTIYGFNTSTYYNSTFEITNGYVSSSVRSGTTLTLTIGSGRVTFLNIDPNANLDITQSVVAGGSGDDTIHNSWGQYQIINGGAGNDSIFNEWSSNVCIVGGTGDDTVSLSYSDNVTIGYASGDGNDHIYGFDSNDVFNITSGNISSSVRSGADLILEIGSGRVTLHGESDDQIFDIRKTSTSKNVVESPNYFSYGITKNASNESLNHGSEIAYYAGSTLFLDTDQNTVIDLSDSRYENISVIDASNGSGADRFIYDSGNITIQNGDSTDIIDLSNYSFYEVSAQFTGTGLILTMDNSSLNVEGTSLTSFYFSDGIRIADFTNQTF